MPNMQTVRPNPRKASLPPKEVFCHDARDPERAISYVEDQTRHRVRNEKSMDVEMDQLFDNLPKLMRTEQFAEHFGYSKATIYDWRYRGAMRGVPSSLFLTLNRRLYIRTDIFLAWLASQNPNLDG